MKTTVIVRTAVLEWELKYKFCGQFTCIPKVLHHDLTFFNPQVNQWLTWLQETEEDDEEEEDVQ